MYPLIEVDVLAFQDKATVCWMVAPVPLAVSEIELEPPVKKEMLVEAVAAAVGAKVTVKGTICPAAIVTGKASPLSVNWELLELADDRVTLPPVAVRLPFWGLVVPTVTVPKLIETGVSASVPVAVVAVPDRATATEGSDASELRARVAEAVPATVGANTTDKLALAPAARV